MTEQEKEILSPATIEEKWRLLDLDKEELQTVLQEMGFPQYRLSQIRRRIFSRKASSFQEITDISKEARQRLIDRFAIPGNDSIFSGREIARHGAEDQTQKLLIEFSDGHRVEAVLLRDDRQHRTGCISTQVGCAMGCAFCASGLDGFVRNLTRGEILEQILRLNALLGREDRLTHLVIMGTGEPLLNLEALLSALKDVTAQDGLDLGNRRVTISTVGLPEGIRKMAALKLPYKLAISLHAPNDELRNRLVPQNKYVGIKKLLLASDEYFQATGRRVTFEYILIDRVNSTLEHARELAHLLRGRTAIVNLIPCNPVPEFSFRPPESDQVHRFADQLEREGIQVKIRFRKGDRINAACGQLRRSMRKKTTENSSNDLTPSTDQTTPSHCE